MVKPKRKSKRESHLSKLIPLRCVAAAINNEEKKTSLDNEKNIPRPYSLNAPADSRAAMLAFDIETTGLDAARCVVTVVCTEDYLTGEQRAYEFARVRDETPEDLDELREAMARQLDEATSLCAFNGVRFDIPFLQHALGIPPSRALAWTLKTSDILEQCRLLHACTFSLNMLCAANGVQVKSSSGLEAVHMAQRREWQRLREYCTDDVRILCDLYRKRTLVNPRTQATLNLADMAHPALYRPPQAEGGAEALGEVAGALGGVAEALGELQRTVAKLARALSEPKTTNE